MKLSEYQKARVQRVKDQAIELHKLGHSYRAIAKTIGYSHQWVANTVNEMRKSQTGDNSLT